MLGTEERERRAAIPGTLSVGGSFQGARLPGLQDLAGISQALWSKQDYHHGNHCQGIFQPGVHWGPAWMRIRVAAFLGVGDGRGRKQADSVHLHSSQTPPTARGSAQHIPERSLKKAREMGEARRTG